MKKKTLISIVTCSIALMCIAMVSLNDYGIAGNADTQSYKLIMNSSKNKLHNASESMIGDANLKTELGNEIGFYYYCVNGSDSSWHTFEENGYINNTKSIHGLKNISVDISSSNSSYKILYSFDTSFSFSSEVFNESVTFNFNETYPNYFKVVNTSNNKLVIDEIILEYRCFSTEYKNLTITNSEETKGNIEGNEGSILVGEPVEIKATPNNGYKFIGWYKGDELYSDKAIYSFFMPYEDLNLEARWDIVTYSITYKLNGGSFGGDNPNPTTYTVEDLPITLQGVNRTEEDTFVGWLLNGSSSHTINVIEKGTYGNLDLEAAFLTKTYKAHISSSNTNRGTVTGGSNYRAGYRVNITATAMSDYCFVGWYDELGLISKNAEYSFTMPKHEVNYQAIFWSQDEVAQFHAPTPKVNGNIVSYGLHPQSVETDQNVIDKLVYIEQNRGSDDNGWVNYNGVFYKKITATPVHKNLTFDNGSKISYGQTYWFRCEAIKWKILSNFGGEYFLISKLITDNVNFTDSYEHMTYDLSKLRNLLNNDFYNSAFSNYVESSYIMTTSINDGEMYDKVFALSKEEFENTYYFANEDARIAKTTDYSRAKGADNYISSEDGGNYGTYWTRTPKTYGFTYYISQNGIVSDYDPAGTSKIGVRPSITIKI